MDAGDIPTGGTAFPVDSAKVATAIGLKVEEQVLVVIVAGLHKAGLLVDFCTQPKADVTTPDIFVRVRLGLRMVTYVFDVKTSPMAHNLDSRLVGDLVDCFFTLVSHPDAQLFSVLLQVAPGITTRLEHFQRAVGHDHLLQTDWQAWQLKEDGFNTLVKQGLSQKVKSSAGLEEFDLTGPALAKALPRVLLITTPTTQEFIRSFSASNLGGASEEVFAGLVHQVTTLFERCFADPTVTVSDTELGQIIQEYRKKRLVTVEELIRSKAESDSLKAEVAALRARYEPSKHVPTHHMTQSGLLFNRAAPSETEMPRAKRRKLTDDTSVVDLATASATAAVTTTEPRLSGGSRHPGTEGLVTVPGGLTTADPSLLAPFAMSSGTASPRDTTHAVKGEISGFALAQGTGSWRGFRQRGRGSRSGTTPAPNAFAAGPTLLPSPLAAAPDPTGGAGEGPGAGDNGPGRCTVCQVQISTGTKCYYCRGK